MADFDDTTRALLATYVDYKLVKTRSAMALIFEVAIEHQQRVHQLLGPVLPGQETWVAIAVVSKEAKEAKDKAQEDRIVQRAVLLCKEPVFQGWIAQQAKYGGGPSFPGETSSEEFARSCILRFCGIDSRAELKTNALARTKFNYILADFDIHTGRRAEPR